MRKSITAAFICLQVFGQVQNRIDRDLQEVGPESSNVNDAGLEQDLPASEFHPAATNPVIVGELIQIRGIVLIKGNANPAKVEKSPNITLKLEDRAPPTLRGALEPFISAPLNKETIREIKLAIVEAYGEANQQHVIPILPEQDISSGILIIQILEGPANQVYYFGQKWTSISNLKNKLEIQKGDPVDLQKLLDNIAWLNKNPFHTTEMTFSQSAQQNAIDIDFFTSDRFPLRTFVGSDNTGLRINSQTRLYAGFNWGNAFFRDDIFTFQYTASPGFHRFQSYVGNYTLFLNSIHDVLEVFGSYAQIYPDLPGFFVEGRNAQGSCRYQKYLKPISGSFNGFLEIGFDYKWQTSNLFYESTPLENPPVRQILAINQLVLGYAFNFRNDEHALSCKAEIFGSVWKNLFPHQTTEDFENSRSHSLPYYGYLQFGISDQWQFRRNWFLSMLFRGQVGSGTLPASEEYGIGGEDTVRGYYEQQFTADNVAILNLELYFPQFNVSKKLKDTVSTLVFIDWAYGYNYHASPLFKRAQLVGIGPGIRYDIAPYFHFQCDYGVKLLNIEGDPNFGRFQLAGTLSY